MSVIKDGREFRAFDEVPMLAQIKIEGEAEPVEYETTLDINLNYCPVGYNIPQYALIATREAFRKRAIQTYRRGLRIMLDKMDIRPLGVCHLRLTMSQ